MSIKVVLRENDGEWSMGEYVVLFSDEKISKPNLGGELMAVPAANNGAAAFEARLANVADEPAPNLRIDQLVLAKSEIKDVLADERVVGIARVMPTTLVEPFAAEENPSRSGEGAGRDRSGPPYPTWGISAVGADKSRRDGAGVKVAVLDTGIDPNWQKHQAFASIARLEQRDYTATDSTPGLAPDTNGHGTHCAGTICGRAVGELRIGVAPGVQDLFVGKVLGPKGGDTAMLYRGMQEAMTWGANVISMSLGFDFPGMVKRLVAQEWPVAQATSRALEAYRQNLRLFDNLVRSLQTAPGGQGVIIVAATGNESVGGDKPMRLSASLPAAAEGIFSIGALERAGEKLKVADFSNSLARFVAPGVDITSAAIGGGVKSLSGTSMATPHVAGVAALWWQELAAQAPFQVSMAERVRARLDNSPAADVLAKGYDPADVGFGLVQAPGP